MTRMTCRAWCTGCAHDLITKQTLGTGFLKMWHLPSGHNRRKVVDVENGVPGLAELFAELTGTLLSDVGPTEVLALLTSRCPAMLRVESAGGVVIDGSQMVITGSHETAKALM